MTVEKLLTQTANLQKFFVDGKLEKSVLVKSQNILRHIYHLVSPPLPLATAWLLGAVRNRKAEWVLQALQAFFQSKILPSWGFQSTELRQKTMFDMSICKVFDSRMPLQ